jgi:hypothetical protein
MGGISVFAKLVYSIDLAEKTGQFNYFDERLRLTKISHLIFQSRQLPPIFAAFFKKWLFYRHFCIKPDEALTSLGF